MRIAELELLDHAAHDDVLSASKNTANEWCANAGTTATSNNALPTRSELLFIAFMFYRLPVPRPAISLTPNNRHENRGG